MQKRSIKRLAQPVIGGLAAVALLSGTALAGASQNGSLLVVGGSSSSDSISLTATREANGANSVTLFNVPGVADGATFSGITQINIFTSTDSDSVEMEIEAEALMVNVNNSTREFSGKVMVTTPPGIDDVALGFNFNTGTRSDSVEMEILNSAANFDLNVGFNFGTRSSTMKVGIENLANNTANMAFNGVGGTRDDTFELVAKGQGSFNVTGTVRVESAKVEIEGNAGGSITLPGEGFGSKAEYIVKGDLSGSPTLTGLEQATFLVEGNLTGFPTINAGQCSVQPLTANVTTNGCENR